MRKSEKNKCHAIIHTAALASAGIAAGLAQLPLSDNAVLVPIQITMIISLGNIFGKRIEDSVAKSILSTQLASFIGRSLSQVLLGWVPGLGNIINAASASAITEAVGWAVVEDFSRKEDVGFGYNREY